MGCARGHGGRVQARVHRLLDGPAPFHSRGLELPSPDRSRGGRGGVRLAHTLLVVPSQARQGPAILDPPCFTGPKHRSLSLGEPTTVGTGTDETAELPGHLAHPGPRADRAPARWE